ncbi:MAG: hypothetical protein QXW35_05200 [Candidatus Aenigmatarchaeota archaeon]
MGKTLQVIQFINDLYSYIEKLKKKQKYELEDYYISGKFKFYHPGAILGSILIDKKLSFYNNINDDFYYIFYDLLAQKFIYLEGSQVKTLNCIIPNRFPVKKISNKIKDWSDIIKNSENIRKIISKELIPDFSKWLMDYSGGCSLFNTTTKTNTSFNMLLLDATYEFEDEYDVMHYINDQLYTILSLYIFLDYDYECSCYDGEFLKEKTIREFIKYIKKQFTKYERLNESIYFNVYPSFIANADGRQCCSSIYIDFEVTNPFDILTTFELLDILDKI